MGKKGKAPPRKPPPPKKASKPNTVPRPEAKGKTEVAPPPLPLPGAEADLDEPITMSLPLCPKQQCMDDEAFGLDATDTPSKRRRLSRRDTEDQADRIIANKLGRDFGVSIIDGHRERCW